MWKKSQRHLEEIANDAIDHANRYPSNSDAQKTANDASDRVRVARRAAQQD